MIVQDSHEAPVGKARLAGFLYLVVIVAAGFAEGYVRGRLVVRNDAVATAANIMNHQLKYRLGGAADLVNFVSDVAMALIFYQLLRGVSRAAALPMLFFKVGGDILGAMILLFHFAPLVLLSSASYMTVFTTSQLQALALTALRLHAQGYNVAMVFFGVHNVLLGYLAYKSRFWPALVGVALALSGVCYVFNSFSRLIVPAFASLLFPYILWPGLVAEAALMLSLLIVGVSKPAWKEWSLSANGSGNLGQQAI